MLVVLATWLVTMAGVEDAGIKVGMVEEVDVVGSILVDVVVAYAVGIICEKNEEIKSRAREATVACAGTTILVVVPVSIGALDDELSTGSGNDIFEGTLVDTGISRIDGVEFSGRTTEFTVESEGASGTVALEVSGEDVVATVGEVPGGNGDDVVLDPVSTTTGTTTGGTATTAGTAGLLVSGSASSVLVEPASWM